MIAASIIERAAADGVVLALTPTGAIKATGGRDAVNRWHQILLESKPGIVAALRAANDAALARVTPEQAAELRSLIERVLSETPDEWDEVHGVACADPEAALTSFRALAADLQPIIPLLRSR